MSASDDRSGTGRAGLNPPRQASDGRSGAGRGGLNPPRQAADDRSGAGREAVHPQHQAPAGQSAAASGSQAPRFAAGDRIRVKDDWPERRGPCHIRTPHYLRGREGTVERVLGTFANPEDLAFARPAPLRPLYHVLFDQPPIWHEGAAGDMLLVEIFEHWLEPATPAKQAA